jgi:hypothetical protein
MTLPCESGETRLQASLRAFSQSMRPRPSEARLLGALLEFPCPARLHAELTSSSWKEIDRLYSERHDFIRRLLIDHLRSRLGPLNADLSIEAEHASNTGKVDIALETMPAESQVRPPLKIHIEIKGGRNFQMAQLIRYLWNSDAVILCLAGSGKAFTIRKQDARGFLDFLEEVLSAKMKLLEQDTGTRIAGPWCRGCTVACPHAKKEFPRSLDFQKDLVEPLTNWSKAIDKTVTQVIQLLETSNEPKLSAER